MEKSKELLDKAGIIPDLKLAVKKQGGGTTSTGTHRVKVISDKLVQGTEFETGKVIPMVRYLFEENGEQRQYDVPVKDKKGDLHYLVQRLAEVKEGEEIIMEYKRKGLKGYIDVMRLQTNDEDVIDINENEPTTDDEDGESPDVPFQN